MLEAQLTLTKTMNTKIIYHQVKPGLDCVDGIASAWVAHKFYPNADLIGCVYGDVPDVNPGEELLILDFSFPAKQLEYWADMDCNVVVIDHHKTAMNDLSSLSDKIFTRFDMNECGATLTWKYFLGGEVPAFLNYIKDRDLWNFELPESEELHEAIGFIGRTFALFDALEPLSQEQLIAAFAPLGRKLLVGKRQRIKELGNTAVEQSVAGYNVMVVEIHPEELWLTSDVCSYVYKKYPQVPFVMAYSGIEGDYQLSFRSDKKGSNFDVSEIAKVFGGGGHSAASGAKTKKLPWEFISI